MTSVRPGASEGAHAAKLNTVLYHFYAKTVAVACESRAPSAPSAARANKWFSLSLGEIDRMRDRLRPWRAPSDGSVPRLPAAHDIRLPAVYKRAIVHFRTLYALARALPAQALCRSIAAGSDAPPLDVEIEVHAGTDAGADDLGADPKTWALQGVHTPIGTLACRVAYRACTELRVEQRGNAVPCTDAALPMPPRERDVLTPPARRPRSRSLTPRPPGVGTPVTPHASGALPPDTTSPLLRRMWTDAGDAPVVPVVPTSGVRPRRGVSPSGPEASPEGLRALFQSYTPTRAQIGLSPSSLYSLRHSPHGHFDAHMRRRAETVSETPPERARPVRIQRYARQPSYRQREFSRSAGGAHDELSTSARSWSQRVEQRRMMERGIAREAPAPRSQPSPSGSRLFANTAPSHAPAFALSKPGSAGGSTSAAGAAHASPSDDLFELVQMLEAPPALHAAAPPARTSGVSLTRTPSSVGPRRSLGAVRGDPIDDFLARLADSVHLPAMDERFGEVERTAPAPYPIRYVPHALGVDEAY
ncbi:hypothetical protein CBS9595_002494 [Malassezia furfur]|nr:hypothetical protein CBS9595_002494 [Malassezia furfur]